MIFLLKLLTLVLVIDRLNAALNDAPVLGLYNSISSAPSQPIGRVTSSAEFEQQLPTLLADTKELNIILVTGNLNSRKEIKESVQKSNLNDNVIYQSQVEQPLETLVKYAQDKGITVTTEKIVYFDDALIRFQQKQALLGKQASLILTAELSHNQRSKRAVANSLEAPDNYTIFGSECAAFLKSITYKDESDASQKKDIANLTIDEANSKFDCISNLTQTLTISFDSNNTGILGQPITQLSFEFKPTNSSLYYELSKASIQLKNSDVYQISYMGTPYAMETPNNYSFACTRTVFQLRNLTTNTRVTFYINKLQLQAKSVSVNNSQYTFSKLNYCQGFFTSGIWMAISASLLLALILSCGVSALMNIKTMDRFDDPKGKPLNIGLEK